MRRPLAALLLLATPLAPIVSSAPAVAQGSASYNFLKAVRDRDGAKAIDLLKSIEGEDERERVAVFMDGLSQMRSEWAMGKVKTRK